THAGVWVSLRAAQHPPPHHHCYSRRPATSPTPTWNWFPGRRSHYLASALGTNAASNPHSLPRPPQTPSASFLSPYRKRLGSEFTSCPACLHRGVSDQG